MTAPGDLAGIIFTQLGFIGHDAGPNQVFGARRGNRTGGRFTDFMLGGLNRQIEHHLFPSMPRPNLRRVQGLVRDFCVAADLCYSEESFVESFRQIVDGRHRGARQTASTLLPSGSRTKAP